MAKIKLIMFILGLLAMELFGDPVTNVNDILNVSLTKNILTNIICNVSTPERTYLSYVRTTELAELVSFLGLWDGEALSQELNMSINSNISYAEQDEFRDFVLNNNVTNKSITAYSCVVTGNQARITARMRSYTPNRVEEENIELLLQKKINDWKIIKWE